MLAVTDPRVHTVTVMSCTQLLKTEILNNTAGYYIHQDPAPILLIQPTTKLGESWSKDRFDKMRRDTPVIKERVKNPRERDSGTTITHKDFDGGHLTIVGANSPVDLASRPIRVVLSDEVDKYPASAGNEGDPIKLAEERAASFWNRKFVRACSPTIDGVSRIQTEYEKSDQRKPFIACPHCGAEQVLEFEQVKWDKNADGKHLPKTARYHCVECQKPWEESWRLRTLRTAGSISWKQTAPFTCCGIEQEPKRWTADGTSVCEHCATATPFDGHAGFWASKMYSPWGRLVEVVEKWLDAVKSKNSEILKTFFNTQLGKPFQIAGDAPEWKRLYERRDHYPLGTVPRGVCFLTAGIDVQRANEGRLEMHVWGWGRGLESWLIDVLVFEGVVADINNPVWRNLESALQRTWETEGGVELPIHRAAIDTGDGLMTPVIYDWCRRQGRGQIVAIKGEKERSSGTSPVNGPSFVDVRSNGKKFTKGLALFLVNGPYFKRELYSQLRLEKPTDDDIQNGVCFPDGYVHIAGLGTTSEWVEQLVAEQLVTEKKKLSKFSVQRWVKVRERNEALDCRVYARAMAWLVGADRWSDNQWSRLEVQANAQEPRVKRKQVPPARNPTPVNDNQPAPAAMPTAPSKPRKAKSTWL